MLIDFEASPAFTRIQRMFTSSFNRYRVSPATWSTEQDESFDEREEELFLSAMNPDITKASQVLSEQVHGYSTHFAARRKQALEGRTFALSPTWTDLMMWALLIGGKTHYRTRYLLCLSSDRWCELVGFGRARLGRASLVEDIATTQGCCDGLLHVPSALQGPKARTRFTVSSRAKVRSVCGRIWV